MKRKVGFTIIEVSIYLALSGLLVVGVIAALTPSINQQRFYDATQNFADFLRSVYSQVANPQSVESSAGGGGRSELAIYGKLIVFGEEKGLDGTTNVNTNVNSEQKIYVYDVVGDASGQLTNNDLKTALGATGAKANVLINSGGTYRPAGLVQEYTMRWGTAVEKTTRAPGTDEFASRWTGSILIVRHPSSGTVSTLVADTVVQANTTTGAAAATLLTNVLTEFGSEEINFCINRDSSSNNTGNRWNVRIKANAHSATDVEVRDLDGNSLTGTSACNS